MSIGFPNHNFFRLVAPLSGLLTVISLIPNFPSPGRQPAVVHSATDSKEEIKLDVPFEPSTMEVVGEMLTIARVGKDDLVYDLGCGDGRIVIAAAKTAGARGVGVDLDPQRIRESRENARKAGVAEQVKFYVQDFFQTDIHEATVVMLYLWPEVNLRLRSKLFQELRPGARVVSHSHDMGAWESDGAVVAANGHKIYFWVIPANISGAWEGERPGSNGKERWTLRLRQRFQKVQGTLHAGPREIPLQDLRLKGDCLQFTAEQNVAGQVRAWKFKGKAKGHSLEGTLEEMSAGITSGYRWKASRDPSSATRIDD